MSEPLDKHQVHYFGGRPVNPFPMLTARAEAFDLGVKAAQVAASMLEDAARLDWLGKHLVTVRIPMPYGSRECFIGAPDDNDGEPDTPWNVREAIDAARKQGGA